MPDDVKPDSKPDTTPAPDLADSIATALARELPKAFEAARAPEPAPAPRDDTIADVDDDQIVDAIEKGDKVLASRLLKQQRAASEQRILRQTGGSFNQGAAVLSELSETVLRDDPHFRTYEKEIRGEIKKLQASNPGALLTPDIWRAARDLVVGRHADDIAAGAREAMIRRARDGGITLTPDGNIKTGRDDAPHDPADDITELAEKGSRFEEFLRNKSRAHGGRSDDDEVRVMAAKSDRLAGNYDEEASKRTGRAVFRKSTYPNGIKDYWKEHEEMKRYAAEHPTLGLDE